MRSLRVPALFLFSVLACGSAYADDYCRHYDNEPGGPDALKVSYLVDEYARAGDTRATPYDDHGKPEWRIDLKGYLWLPEPPRKAHGYPVLVYNHGHDSTQPPCSIVNFFRKRGFLVFAPLRRGQGGISTGIDIETYSKQCDDCDEQAAHDARENEYLQKQSEDIVDAVAFIARNDYANPNRIAIMGHSYGGMAVLYANTLLPELKKGEHRAIIDISGGELTWERNPIIRVSLPLAVLHGRYPILFLQPANGVSLGPMTLLNAAGKDGQGHVYPPILKLDPDPDDDVHTHFIKSREQVFGGTATPGWGEDAVRFLERLDIK